jgi:putative transposase
VKTVPTLRVVSTSDTAEQLERLGVADLPAEVQLALADIASVAREGLLAMSVAAGMAVMQTMFDAEVAAACGPKGPSRRGPNRLAAWQRAWLGGAGWAAGAGDPSASPNHRRT